MRAIVVALLVACLTAAPGCGARVPAPSGPIRESGAEPTATATRIYEGNFVGASIEVTSERGDPPDDRRGILRVALRSGDPTVVQAFGALSLLHRLQPGLRFYEVRHTSATSTVTFVWVPEGTQVQIRAGGGRILSVASGVDTGTLDAVGDHRQPVPLFEYTH